MFLGDDEKWVGLLGCEEQVPMPQLKRARSAHYKALSKNGKMTLISVPCVLSFPHAITYMLTILSVVLFQKQK